MTTIKRKAVWPLISNFFIWLIPGVFVFIVLFIALLLVAGASADIHGIEGEFKKRIPKGMISFLGISFFLAGIGCTALLFIYHDMEITGMITIIATGLASYLLGFWGIRSELRRLSKTL